MVFTRSQTENLSRDKLVEELLKLLDVSSELSDPSEKFSDFVSKCGKVYLELQRSRNCNFYLLQRIIWVEKNAVTNHRRGSNEINPVPKSLRDEILEKNICKALCLTGVSVTPEELQVLYASVASKDKKLFLIEKI